MSLISRMFGSPSIETVLRRARNRLAAGDFDRAQRAVEDGLAAWPEAEPLRELELSIRRAQARAGIRSLRELIVRDEDKRAYEQIIALYSELGMQAEARVESLAYATAHPDCDTAHLLLGEMSLEAFLDDLQARDAHVAHDRLRRAAGLNPMAIKPRLLLAELYYCVGADAALARVGAELEAFGQTDGNIQTILDKIRELETPAGTPPVDGLFERVEVEGTLYREPATWPMGARSGRSGDVGADRAQRAADALVQRGSAAEVVLLQRSGRLLGHAIRAVPGEDAAEPDPGLVDVVRTVSRTVSRYARDLDLGAFKRCTIQGDFGLVAVGEVGAVVTGARWPKRHEPQRLWERVAIDLESSLGGARR